MVEGGRGMEGVTWTTLTHPLAQSLDQLTILDINVSLSRHTVICLRTHSVIFNRKFIALSPLLAHRVLVLLVEGPVIDEVVLARGIVFYFAGLEAFLVFLIPQNLADGESVIQLLAPYILHLLQDGLFLLGDKLESYRALVVVLGGSRAMGLGRDAEEGSVLGCLEYPLRFLGDRRHLLTLGEMTELVIDTLVERWHIGLHTLSWRFFETVGLGERANLRLF